MEVTLDLKVLKNKEFKIYILIIKSNNSLYTVHTTQSNNSLYTVHTTQSNNSLYTVHTTQSNNSLYTVHTTQSNNNLYIEYMTCLPPSQDSSQHIKCWKTYAITYGLSFLKMDIMVPETCWANGWLINHNCCIKLVSQIVSVIKHSDQTRS
jgi:hypothetical protein